MDLTILKDIVIIFSLSTVVNFLFTKIKVPPIIGYMLTGILAGPYVLSIIESHHEIELMAEIGVVLLMFTIGLEFSLKHLVKIRRIVFLGGLIQFIATAVVFLFISRTYEMSWNSALFIGFLTALSSTAVVLKLLQERSELTSNYGRTVLGILIFQDLILVPLLLFTPLLSGEGGNFGNEILTLSIKTLAIMGFVYVGNKWLMPKILHWIALTKNQELFVMSILLICLAVALLTSELGMSLAFGAFLAGLMISESEYSHNAFGHLIPFRDTFTSFFFVSIGMLLDLNFVIENISLVASTVIIVIVVKTLIAGGTGFILGHTFRGTVLVGLALSQVGEFSFILVKSGYSFNIISTFFYQLFLAVAIISMSISPFLINWSGFIANKLLKLPLPEVWIKGLFPLKEIQPPKLNNHLVIIGKDTRAFNLSKMAQLLDIPYISIVFDPAIVHERQKNNDPVIYGDALNEPVLLKAHCDVAEIIVISIGDAITTKAIIDKIRNLNKHAHIIVRGKHLHDMENLYKTGANEVLPEEFETAIDMLERVMGKYLFPVNTINKTTANLRNDHYGIFREKSSTNKNSVTSHLPNIEISALNVEKNSGLVGKALYEIRLREKFGTTVVAIKRGDSIIEIPEKDTTFMEGDTAYIMGSPKEIAKTFDLFSYNETETDTDKRKKSRP